MKNSKKSNSLKETEGQLSLAELHLLTELENDARKPLSQLAKKLNISQQLLSYRLQNLQRKGILYGFYTMINFTMFGYTRYRVMTRLSNFSQKKFDDIISYLTKHPNVQWIVECGGRWDLLFNYMAKNIIQLDEFLRELKKRFPEQFQNYGILTVVETIELGRDYFIKKSRESKVLSYFGREYNPMKVDGKDLKILDLISENARLNSVEIAEKVGVTPNTVILRIKNMKKKGIIHAFRPLIHLENASYSSYKAPIKFQNITETKEKEIVNYLKKKVNVIAIIKLIGEWDFEVEFEVNSKQAMIELTRNLRDEFKDVIRDFELIPLYHEYRYNFFPRDLLDK